MDVNNDMTEIMEIDQSVMTGNLKSVLPLTLVRVDKTAQEALWDELMRKYHYLGYQKMIGQRIKYLVKSGDRPIAAISYNRAAQRVAARDSYIGWNEERRLEQLKYVVSNNRFLILPWVHVRYLASHVLALSLKQVRQDWEKSYGIRPLLAETFIDITQYRGTCYKAANWIHVGETKGYGKVGKHYAYHGNKKAVYLYELDHAYRQKIDCSVAPKPKRLTPSQIKQREARRMLLGIPDWDERILSDCGLDKKVVAGLGERLETYLNGFSKACINSKQMDLLSVFIKGLFSDLDRKSIEPIALRYDDQTGVRNLQTFFSHGKVSQETLLEQHQQNVMALLGEASGMTNVDGSDFPKKGKNSVAVARQHCGILGKTDNCQAGVFAGYSSSQGYTLLDRRLYVPQKWFGPEYADRRDKCGFAEDLAFKSKNELALEMLQQLEERGMPFQWIGCDSAFGADREFLAGLPERCYYFADIRENQLVFLEMPEMVVPENKHKRGRRSQYPRPSIVPVCVESIAQDSAIPWETTVLGEGSKGPIVAKTKCLRVIRTQINQGGNKCVAPLGEVWLYIRHYENGRIKYSLSNAPADIARTELDRAATMRWPIEQCFNECKSYLGMDHYESRSWNAWHLHMVLVMIAHFFTMMLRHTYKKDTPVLSMPMAKQLVGASLTNSLKVISKALKMVDYHLKRNAIAYRSHRKKKLQDLVILNECLAL
jgi:SRSO17 transposase